ncbi:MAG: right-handed parallel beta-helix repeat-containing protein [Phycisphaerales bacterium]
MRTALTAAVALLASSTIASAATIYVNASLATGNNDGTSWTDAYRGPQALKTAMDASTMNDVIWVAKGTYTASPNVRTVSHVLKLGVSVYGGFIGNESSLAERDPVANTTVISGDLLGNDDATAASRSDNSYHLVTPGTGSTQLMDGFELRGGNANGATAQNFDKGGAVICLASQSPTFRSCRFIDNRCTFGGGAGYLLSSSPKFFDCLFQDNQGGSFGGAFDSANSTQPTFERCTFKGNKAARAGALEFFGGSQPKVTNCLFVGNQSTGSGGGGAIWLGSSSNGTFRNLTVTGNSATVVGGGIYNTGGTSTFANCISFGNTGPGTTADNGIKSQGGTSTITYSDVQGITTGTGNLNLDPKFVDVAGGNHRLQATSPCIDAANNAAVPAGTITDLDSLPRFVDQPSVPDTGAGVAPIVDMGAYELQFTAPPCPTDLTGDGATGADDLGVLLGAWGSAAADLDGDGTTGASDLAILLGAWGPC